MAGWPRLRPRRLPWPESGAVEDNYAAMVGGGAERAQPARSRDVQQLPRRAQCVVTQDRGWQRAGLW